MISILVLISTFLTIFIVHFKTKKIWKTRLLHLRKKEEIWGFDHLQAFLKENQRN